MPARRQPPIRERLRSVAALLSRRVRGRSAAFGRDRRGVVAIILGLAILPLMTLMGIAFDYSRANAERAAFQAAMDSGVMAGASVNIPDDQRSARAANAFAVMLSPDLCSKISAANAATSSTSSTSSSKARIGAAVTVSADTASAGSASSNCTGNSTYGANSNPSFVVSTDKTTITGTVRFRTETQFRLFTTQRYIEQTITATARIARPQVRQLDLVMCIDGTGSMTSTINAVKQNALNLETNINDELKRRFLPAFDAMRVRPIFYRDYGGNSWFDPTRGGWALTATSLIWTSSSDPMTGMYVGDIPPVDVSNFFSLPDQRTLFSTTVSAEYAWGGGDEPESGLECVNEAMNSAFAKVGDKLASGQVLTGVIPVIAVWTDANAHPPGHPTSLQNPLYPPASNMPRTHAGLLAKWNDATKIDQTNRLLVFFGGPSTTGMPMDPLGWPPVQAWPGYVYGGTLATGNSQMVTRIVDAISTKFAQPTITH